MQVIQHAVHHKLRASQLAAELDLDALAKRLEHDAIADPGRAKEAFLAGDAVGFCCSAGNMSDQLAAVFDNRLLLMARGIYEEALLNVYVNTKSNFHRWDRECIDLLWLLCDRDRTRELGDPIPNAEGKIRIFRGVHGAAEDRWPRGWSWTVDLPTACWFATRYGQEDPTVYSARVRPDQVMCYLHGSARREHEVIYQPARVYKTKLDPTEIAAKA